ncbi:MAG: T9SS type A sorting domain-containing protein, partial [Crocinitomicaceae bacterium]|nr:T9SS type A sorting domain-containing protein [Crocinitomicaceae bacterium]
TTFCAGGSVNLTSSQPSGNVWSTIETTQTINVIGSGNYTVTYMDGNGCSSTSVPVSVTVNATPVTPIVTASGPIIFCDGGSVDLTSDQTTGIVWSSTETTATISVTSSGTFDVTYTDGNGCSATSSPINVIVNSLPTVTLGVLVDVCNYTAAFSLSGGSPAGGAYSGTGVSSGIFDPSVAGNGTHTITYDYTDVNGCSASAQQDIFVDGCEDLQEITNADVIVYPNPTSTQVNVYVQGALINNVKVFDGAGRLIAEYNETSEKVTVDLSQVARGVYHLDIALGDQVYRSRVVKN